MNRSPVHAADEARTATTEASSFEALRGRSDMVWMGQNTTHLEPPAEVVEALEESVRTREFQFYAPPLGFERLRALVVEDLGLRDAQAWITDGAVNGLHHICTVLARDVAQLITTDPGWPWPERFVSFGEVPVRTLGIYDSAEAYKLSAARIAEVVQPRSLIYLIDPLNPLGSCYSRAELDQIATVARDTDSLVVHDCTYRHFADDHTLVAELYPEGTLTTYSFSKWLGLAGLRLGAVVAEPALLSRLTSVPANPLGANIQAQRAAIAGIEVKRPWLARLRQTNRHNQETVARAVATSGLGSVVVSPSQGNFVAIDIGDSGWYADDLCEALLERGVFIRSGNYQSASYGDRFVKVSTSVPTSWAERFAEAWTASRAAEGTD